MIRLSQILGIFLTLAGLDTFAQLDVDLVAAALKNAKPGETVVVKNNIVRDRKLIWSGRGTAEKPVVIRPESPGGVVFSGKSALKISGGFVVVSGFVFQDGYSPEKQVVALEGTGCRFTNSVIDSFNPPDVGKEDKWVTLRGKNHRVDGCSFLNKTAKSVTLVVWRDDPDEDGHIISGNLFSGRPKGEKSNDYETIRIGTSHQSASDSKTVVEGNLFEECDGEMEIISVKSGKNIIRGNTFMKCAGTLTLRHGNGSLVEGNVFAGKLKKETGGIRIYGKNHVIRGNAFIGTTGRADAVIAFMAGNPNPELHEFHRAESITIEKNLFAANKGLLFKFDAEFENDGRTEIAKNIFVRENNLSGEPNAPLMRGEDKIAPGALKWERTNQVFLNNQFPKDVTRQIPKPLNRDDVGATWYRGKTR